MTTLDLAKKLVFTSAAALALTIAAHAQTYTLDPTVIGGGSVSGTITTDGTLGVLGAGDILDWNIVINNGTSSFDLIGPGIGNNSSVYLQGNSVDATATNLLFNFSGGDGGLLIQNPHIGSDENWFALDNSGSISGMPGTENLTVGIYNGGSSTQELHEEGVHSFADIGGGNNVPDSGSTVLLVGAAIVGLAAFSRRRATA
jgi:hypothetical protein